MKKKVAVVGAGIGGLAAAARLASRGCEVDVYEKLPECGGRAHIISDKGFLFDTGPSFVLMPDFFEEVFLYCGERLEDYLNLKVLDTSYKIVYPDGEVLTVYRDSEKTKHELERFEQGSSRAYDAFLQETARIYSAVKPLLYKCFTAQSLLNPALWPLIYKLKVFQTYWQLAKKFFTNEKICYAMTFEAMFIGVSPFKTPAFYSVITYTDHVQKIAHPMGGMYQIPKALERLGKKFGAQYHYNTEIQRITDAGGSVTLTLDGGAVTADTAVVNADYCYAKEKLLGKRIPDYTYSCSVYLIYLGLKTKVRGIEHHNLFFARDLRKNLRAIFDDKQMPDDPSFYIHAPTVTDSSLAPAGKEIFYILVPVPNLDRCAVDFADYEQQLRETIFSTINKTFNIRLQDLIEVEHRFYPRDFITRYNIPHGATFGLAHTLMQSAFFRPPNRDSANPNVYFVGASTQPGGGLPPVIASSRIIADMITGEK